MSILPKLEYFSNYKYETKVDIFHLKR